MANKWLAHVKKTMKAHKGKKFGEVMKLAKKTYSKKGGADMAEEAEPMEDTSVPAAGRRRRTTKKTGRKTRRAGRR